MTIHYLFTHKKLTAASTVENYDRHYLKAAQYFWKMYHEVGETIVNFIFKIEWTPCTKHQLLIVLLNRDRSINQLCFIFRIFNKFVG